MKRSTPHGLNELITESHLRTEAGERALARGAGHFEPGAVTDLVVSDETLNARVGGGDEHALQLRHEDGGSRRETLSRPVGLAARRISRRRIRLLRPAGQNRHTRLDSVVEQKYDRAYDQSAALVKKVRNPCGARSRNKEFAAWLDAVRARHKARRNLKQRLDKVMAQ